MGGLGDWANFVFWVIFSKISKHQVHGICGQVHLLKNPMLAYSKNMLRNNQFSGVYLPRKKNILPRKIICPNVWKIYPKKPKFSQLPIPPSFICTTMGEVRTEKVSKLIVLTRYVTCLLLSKFLQPLLIRENRLSQHLFEFLLCTPSAVPTACQYWNKKYLNSRRFGIYEILSVFLYYHVRLPIFTE